MADDDGSVTIHINALKGGDRDAATLIWDRYFRRLIGLARSRLPRPGWIEDEQDAALNALDSAFRGIVGGRLQVRDRDELWRLLVVITARKALDQEERRRRKKRGGGQGFESSEFDQVVGGEPTPDFAAEAAEQYRRLLDLLGDDKLRRIAVLRMEGRGRDEIAADLGCAVGTVRNKLLLIRKIWADAGVGPA